MRNSTAFFSIPARKFFAVSLCTWLLFFSASCVQAQAPLRVGISEFADFSINEPIIGATIQALEKELGAENVSSAVYSVEMLQTLAKEGELDLILSSAGTYRRLAIEGAGVRDIATVASERAPNPNYADGSIFFTLASRQDILTVEDLQGKRISANHTYAFSGWQTAVRELMLRGIDDYESFFGSVLFQGHDMTKVVHAVRAGIADAGIVRACFLEDMGMDLSEFRILGAKTSDGKIACEHSTDLYPNWTLSTLPSTPPEISRRIASAVFSMPALEHDLRWGIATDFRAIDELFLNLKIGPYEYLREFSLRRFIDQYSGVLLVFATLVVMLIFHAVRTQILVRRRTQQLVEANARERALEAEAVQASERLAVVERAGIIGQMSSIIAHELRQPLASVQLMVFGLLRRFENGIDNKDVTIKTLEKIAHQNERASEIVNQVRSYAKGNRARSARDICPVVLAAVAEVKKTMRGSRAQIDCKIDYAGPIVLEVNALEIELIVINLVRNAISANKDRENTRILVEVSEDELGPFIRISDNGALISDEDWQQILSSTRYSAHRQGLGLGLLIVRSITEDMGGRVVFSRPNSGGLCVLVRLIAPENNSEISEGTFSTSSPR